MQSVSRNVFLSLIAVSLACGRLVLAQCVTLDDLGCRSVCCCESGCDAICAVPSQASLDPLMPGFLVQTIGPRTIALVIPRSPAAAGGMLSGDEIISVDGESLYSMRIIGWQEARTRTIVVRRGGSLVTLRVNPAPLGEILTRLGSRAESEPVTLRADSRASVPLTPYIAVIVVSRSSECPWMITFVLHGSAAERAGIRPGDRIVAINGVGAQRPNSRQLAQVEGADQPLPIAVVVRRGVALNSANLQMTAISEILRHLAEMPSKVLPAPTLATGDPR